MKNEMPDPMFQVTFKELAGLPAVAEYGYVRAPETYWGTKWQRLEPTWVRVEVPSDWQHWDFRLLLPAAEDFSLESAREPITQFEPKFIELTRRDYVVLGARRRLWLGQTKVPGFMVGKFDTTLYWAIQ